MAKANSEASIKANSEASIKGLGDVYTVIAPWDEALETFRGQGIKGPINARDLAYARIQEEKPSSLSSYGSYIKEGIIYVPNSDILLVRNPGSLNPTSAIKATQAHRRGKEFYLDASMYQEHAEKDKNKDPQDRSVLKLGERKNFEILTNRFGEEELPLWLFEDIAEDYGRVLHKNKISEMPVLFVSQNYADEQKEPFARQLWLDGFAYRSCLSGDDGGLDYDSRVRGVLERTSEAGSRSKLLYNQREVNRLLSLTEKVRKGDVGVGKLEKLTVFLKKLRE